LVSPEQLARLVSKVPQARPVRPELVSPERLARLVSKVFKVQLDLLVIKATRVSRARRESTARPEQPGLLAQPE
jgi:hypothetical protein